MPEPIPEELKEPLARLRWVTPGRDYDPRMVADVRAVLQHFGLDYAHA